MSTDGQPLGAKNVIPSRDAQGLENVDLHGGSTTDVMSIATSRDSLLNATILNTQANAQRPSDHLAPVRSTFVNEHTNDVPLVHSPSPISLPSLVPLPQEIPDSRHYTDTDSRRDPASNSSSRRNTSGATRQDSDPVRQESSAASGHQSGSRQVLDAGSHPIPSTSRRYIDIRRNSDARRNSDSPDPTRTNAPLPRHFAEHLPPGGSPLNVGNTHEESRHYSSRHRSSQALPDAASQSNPYAGRGVYATPQLYASPLPLPQLQGLPPPVDNSRAYSPNTRPNSQFSPTVPIIPPVMPQLAPGLSPLYPGSYFLPSSQPAQSSSRQSISSNIVAAVARTPELSNKRSIADLPMLPDVGWYVHGKQDKSNTGSQTPYYMDSSAKPSRSQTWAAPAEFPSYGNDFYDYGRPSHSRFNQPSVPETYGQQSQSWPPQGSYYNYHEPQRYYPGDQRAYASQPPKSEGPMTAADVVSAASTIPNLKKMKSGSYADDGLYRRPSSASRRNTTASIPERNAAGSFAEHNPYRLPSRKATVETIHERKHAGSFAEHNPYRLPKRRTTVDTISSPPSPPIHPSWLAPPIIPSSWVPPDSYERPAAQKRRNSREHDYYTPNSPRRSHPREDYDSETYRRSPSPGDYSHNRRRRSPSPEDYSRNRHRPRSRSYSPFKYGYGAYGPYPGMPYRTGSFSYDSIPRPPPPRYQVHRQPGYWSRLSTFFKSPFNDGRPTSFHHPYPRSADEETVTLYFILKVIVGQIYFHVLLRLPSLYFSRVSRIFDEANLNLYEITEMVFETSGGPDPKEKAQAAMNMQVIEPVAPKIRPQYERLKSSWEAFIDSLIREWETFNIVSVMLLTAILTILQITTAASDPVTRYAALFSLVCSLVSLLFGCMYIIRFGTMRKTYAAVEWAKSVLGSSQSVIWNVWVLLAMPAVWLTWSIILFIVSIMSFVWRTNPADDSASTFILSSTGLLVVRIVMSTVLAVGLVNALLITHTFRLYGEALDKDWRIWINEWQQAKAIEAPAMNLLTPGNAGIQPGSGYVQPPAYPPFGQPIPYVPIPPPSPWSPPSVVPPQPVIIQPSPYRSDRRSRRQERARHRRRRSANATPGHGHLESDDYSTTSSQSSSPRRRSRRRSRSSSRDISNRHRGGEYSPVHRPSRSVSPRAPTRSSNGKSADNQSSHRATDNNENYTPYIPTMDIEPDRDQDPQGRNVRFRSPLESTQGSSDWGAAYDSSWSSPRVMGPSSSSASGTTGLAHESTTVQIQNSEALRRRRPV